MNDAGDETAIIQPYLHDKRSDYRVMFDHVYGVTADYRSKLTMKKYIKKPFTASYLAGSNTLERNSLKLFLISDVSAAAGTQPARS